MDTVIMTGATGFIGSRIAFHFLRSGWKVYALGRSTGDTPYQTRIINDQRLKIKGSGILIFNL